MSKIINPHRALIYVMVTMSGVDGFIGDKELKRIGRIVKHLPVFRSFHTEELTKVAQECGEILQQEEGGLEAVLGLVKDALPQEIKDTAYALACEVAAADLLVGREELRFLALLRNALSLDKLTIAAIERGVIARYKSYPVSPQDS
ncbi:MAG TPA: tellurite resistance TerB family protein [Aestuariivirgaceae bacterium]|jgi:tellurite resistance protein